MKTIVEYKDGHVAEAEDAAPAVDITPDELILTLIDHEAVVVSDEIPLRNVKRVVFEP